MVDQLKSMSRMLQLVSSFYRASEASGLGQSYDGDRDLYAALGYKTTLTYSDFYGIYQREGIPRRVNDAPCDGVWGAAPRVYDVGDADPSPFEAAWEALADKLYIWNRLCRVDKLLGFGSYAALVLGFNDVQTTAQLALPVRRGAALDYTLCYPAEYATISTTVTNPVDPRFGSPEIYQIDSSQSNASTASQTIVQVHWSRVLHVCEGNLGNDIYGLPRLEVVFNRLKDIEKILGGSAEMYWRGARPGYQAVVDADAQWDPNDPTVTQMRAQLEEFEHNLRRMLTLQGVNVQALQTQVSDPLAHLDAQLMDVSAATGIPKRLLTGSEQGELASSQDRNNWEDVIAARRENWATPMVIRPFVDRLIAAGALPTPVDGKYNIEWPDQRTPSDRELAEVGRTRAEALRAYAGAPGADMVLPPEDFLRYGLGLDRDAVEEISERVADMVAEEPLPDEQPIEEQPAPPGEPGENDITVDVEDSD